MLPQSGPKEFAHSRQAVRLAVFIGATGIAVSVFTYSYSTAALEPFEKARKSVSYRAVVLKYTQVRHSQL